MTKADLLTVLDDFSPEKAEQNLRNLASAVPVFELSIKSPDALDQWLGWLRDEVLAQKTRVANGQSLRPSIQQEGAALHHHPT
ncbi:MAG: hydrogenase nickel incorporation protein HypB [Gammaproteobacteria bacterium]|nr:hydrogenase nickel incorporation protein HypB [Gammaproteobacteria bacterium]